MVKQRSGQERCDLEVAERERPRMQQCAAALRKQAQGASPDDFFHEFLEQVVEALGGLGGAIWMADADRQTRLEYQFRLGETQLLAQDDYLSRHSRLLAAVLERGRPFSVAAGADNSSSLNPTGCHLLMGPLTLDAS